jgi:drug/metabolite transporter (DMT)-like permease
MLCGSFAFSIMSTLAHELGRTDRPWHCDWQVIALSRTILAFLFAAALCRSAGVQLVLWRPGTLWIRSTAGSISLVCTFYAFAKLNVSDVLTLTNVFPVWVALLSWPLLGEMPSASVWLSVVTGVAGVALIQQPHLAAGEYAAVVALISSMATAVAMMGLHHLQNVDPRAVVVHFSGVAIFFALGALCFLDSQVPPFAALKNPLTVLFLVGVGLFATIGQVLLTKAFAAGSPAKVSVVGLSQVVFAVGFDAFLESGTMVEDLREGKLAGWQKLLGMVLVVVPTAWVMLHGQFRRAKVLPVEATSPTLPPPS